MSRDAWWKSFFGGPYGALQPALFSEADNRQACDSIERVVALSPESRVLDVPCGTGRIAIELGRRGHVVTGVDLSETFLRHARRDAERAGQAVSWRQGDMRHLEETASFDLVVCWWGSFGYFDRAGDEAFARGAAAALRPGGALVIDTLLLETSMPRFEPRGFSLVGETYVLEEREYVADTGRLEITWIFLGDRKPLRTDRSSMRLYSLFELSQLLREAGFDTVSLRSKSTGQPVSITERPEEAVVVAARS
jgi:SAM-dependent methyltransferase